MTPAAPIGRPKSNVSGLTFIGVPVSPCTSFSSSDPSSHGSMTAFADAPTTLTPKLTTGFFRWGTKYTCSAPSSTIGGPVTLGGRPNGADGQRYELTRDGPLAVVPFWNLRRRTADMPSRAGRVTKNAYGIRLVTVPRRRTRKP